MLKASLELIRHANSAEQRIRNLIESELKELGSSVKTREGFSDQKLNGIYGDLMFMMTDGEFPIACVECKFSTHIWSFSISDFEKYNSVARWVVVDNRQGIWAISMKDARDHLEEFTDGEVKYWVCHPPFAKHISIRNMCREIQKICGETAEEK